MFLECLLPNSVQQCAKNRNRVFLGVHRFQQLVFAQINRKANDKADASWNGFSVQLYYPNQELYRKIQSFTVQVLEFHQKDI